MRERNPVACKRWPTFPGPHDPHRVAGTSNSTVQNWTDANFLPAYGGLEGVYLLAAHSDIHGRLEGVRVGTHVKPGSERIPNCPEESASGRRCFS